MADEHKKASDEALILICDTNVLVKMALFKPSVMFDAHYSYGKVAVPDFIIEEIRRWTKKAKNKKLKKFGREVIENTIARCERLTGSIRAVETAKHRQQDTVIKAMAKSLSADQKGDDPSDEDRRLIILASENHANLASDEKLHHSLGHCLADKRSVYSFGMLVHDLAASGKLTTKEIEDGLGNLDYHKEQLRREDKELLRELLGRKKKR